MNRRRPVGSSSTLDEIVDERLHRRRVFGRALDEAERMFVAVRVDANRRDEEHIFIHVNAVDLDRQQIEVVKPGFHPRLHARRRQRHEAAEGRRLRQPRSVGRRNVSLGQPDRTLETPRRDVDPHLHRPFAEQVFAVRARPRRAREPAGARSRPCRRKSRSCLWSAPSGAPGVAHPRVALAAAVASCSRISLSVSNPAARQKPKLADMLASASAFNAYVGIAVDVVSAIVYLRMPTGTLPVWPNSGSDLGSTGRDVSPGDMPRPLAVERWAAC